MVDIQVKNLTKFFTIGENLLEGLSFEIQEGECVAIQEVLPSSWMRPISGEASPGKSHLTS